VQLAADANVVLSALIGGQAMRVFRHPKVDQILTTESVLIEVQEYAGVLAHRRGLDADLVLLAAASLPVTTVVRKAYAASLSAARKRIAHRDPDDVDLLALALHFKIPIWSNDNDFNDAGIVRYTTASLLSLLYPR
jgi:predicted nucleic acid-binding protein